MWSWPTSTMSAWAAYSASTNGCTSVSWVEDELKRGWCQVAMTLRDECVARSLTSHCTCGELAVQPPATRPQSLSSTMTCQEAPTAWESYGTVGVPPACGPK